MSRRVKKEELYEQKEEHSVVWIIFNRKYLVSVPEMYCTGKEVIREMGTLTTRDKKLDAALDMAPRRRYCTIAGMVSFFEEGAPVSLLDPKKSVEIYNLVLQHIRNWRYIIETYPDCDPPPVDDFILLDEFAKSVHALALFYTNDGSGSNFAKRLKTISGRHSAFLDRHNKFNSISKRRVVPPHTSDDVNAIIRRLWSEDDYEVYDEHSTE